MYIYQHIEDCTHHDCVCGPAWRAEQAARQQAHTACYGPYQIRYCDYTDLPRRHVTFYGPFDIESHVFEFLGLEPIEGAFRNGG